MRDVELFRLGLAFILSACSLLIVVYLRVSNLYMIYVFIAAITCNRRRWPRSYYIYNKRNCIDINYEEVVK